MSSILTDEGKHSAAEAVYREWIKLLRDDGKAESKMMADALSSLANLFWHQENLTDAEAIYREALMMSRALHTTIPNRLAKT